MSKKYESLAVDIVRLVGRKENVNGLHHCQTRLRFQLKDDRKQESGSKSNRRCIRAGTETEPF